MKYIFHDKGALPHETTPFKTLSHIYKEYHLWIQIHLHSLMHFMQKCAPSNQWSWPWCVLSHFSGGMLCMCVVTWNALVNVDGFQFINDAICKCVRWKFWMVLFYAALLFCHERCRLWFILGMNWKHSMHVYGTMYPHICWICLFNITHIHSIIIKPTPTITFGLWSSALRSGFFWHIKSKKKTEKHLNAMCDTCTLNAF